MDDTHIWHSVTREENERQEHQVLAPWAAFSDESRGRAYPTRPDAVRTAYQRDRDRIIHSAAFRKLAYKTQVYVIHEGDYFRTRLTHTMEVAQIARSLARGLRLNPDLTEAVALAHDVGHTPFGHSGEAALNRLLEQEGGFEHNRQGVRVVEYLERRYRDFPGLNLSFEVREGIAKHSTSYDAPHVAGYNADQAPPLEAQLVDVADEIAFNHHDLDDAMKMHLLNRNDLEAVPWVADLCRQHEDILEVGPEAFDSISRNRLIGALIDMAVFDVLETTTANLREAGIGSLEDVRNAGRRLVEFSAQARERNALLRDFLFKRVYRHPYVIRMTNKADGFISRLFELYIDKPEILPYKYQDRIDGDSLETVVADYISGMTDRYC
ncbi:MAG: deoxyguanosinetriphosphate triphosphohydrolase, partial [Candidatus Sumerlaeota bacterium]